MTPPPPLFHAFLRPAVLQILRAAGYHGARTSVLDSVTDLAARYFLHLCQLTALYATHNSNGIILDDDISPFDFELATPGLLSAANGDTTTAVTNGGGGGGDSLPTPPPPELSPSAAASSQRVLYPPVPTPTIVDVRMALQRAGALLPERLPEEQAYLGEEDMRGVDAFIAWAMGPVNREIKRIALDGVDEATDYLDALKKKHSKNDDDSKYLGTLLGRSIDHGDVVVEGGEFPSIAAWEERRRQAAQLPTPPPPSPRQLQLELQQQQEEQSQKQPDAEEEGPNGNSEEAGDPNASPRPPSSGLSSLGDRNCNHLDHRQDTVAEAAHVTAASPEMEMETDETQPPTTVTAAVLAESSKTQPPTASSPPEMEMGAGEEEETEADEDQPPTTITTAILAEVYKTQPPAASSPDMMEMEAEADESQPPAAPDDSPMMEELEMDDNQTPQPTTVSPPPGQLLLSQEGKARKKKKKKKKQHQQPVQHRNLRSRQPDVVRQTRHRVYTKGKEGGIAAKERGA
ncbi:hypothetical protein VTJ49DRAFT_247 [Mycothermus thermophilus]|uniref:Bromodomain associated domain-containing protein n=1 Tax=Humicola insolens TaxID=85995 RepID=A0ABR3VFI8_HUMIN